MGEVDGVSQGADDRPSESIRQSVPGRVPPRECIRAARDALNRMYSHSDTPVEKLWMFMAEALDWQRRALEQIGGRDEPAPSRQGRNEEAVELLHRLRDLCEENSLMGEQINEWLEELRGMPDVKQVADTRADVAEAFDAIDAYAAKNLDHEMHSIVEHYRRALGVQPPNPDVPAEDAETSSRGRSD